MGYISTKDWLRYIKLLSRLSEDAAEDMRSWVRKNGFADTQALIAHAYGLTTKYGEGTAALAAQMYDVIASLEGVLLADAVPAETASYRTVARTMQAITDVSQNEEMVGSAVGRLVKQAGADTTLQNALRDGAQFAWIPAGDTCAFCLTLASRGWQRASQKSIKNGHAEHIHSNCDCTYAVRFKESTNVRGYRPEVYREMYEDASGSSPNAKINALRRQFYSENKDKINEQKRSAYAKRVDLNAPDAEETDL